MIDLYSLIAIILGLSGVIYCIIVSLRRDGSFPELTDLAIIFFACAAIVAGIRVCILAFSIAIEGFLQTDRIYIFFGGLSLVYVSIINTFRTIRPDLVSYTS